MVMLYELRTVHQIHRESGKIPVVVDWACGSIRTLDPER
ncbi:putative capsid protein [Salmonella phage 19]|nr:putative capsid protein [Salmonella phage 19]